MTYHPRSCRDCKPGRPCKVARIEDAEDDYVMDKAAGLDALWEAAYAARAGEPARYSTATQDGWDPYSGRRTYREADPAKEER